MHSRNAAESIPRPRVFDAMGEKHHREHDEGEEFSGFKGLTSELVLRIVVVFAFLSLVIYYNWD